MGGVTLEVWGWKSMGYSGGCGGEVGTSVNGVGRLGDGMEG